MIDRMPQMIHSHPQRSAMPIKDEREHNSRRYPYQQDGPNRYTWIHSRHYCYWNNRCCYNQFANNQIKGHSSSEVAWFTAIIDKMADRTPLVHLEQATKDFSLATVGTTPQQSSYQKHKCFSHDAILYISQKGSYLFLISYQIKCESAGSS
jgi:hypothetical protein